VIFDGRAPDGPSGAGEDVTVVRHESHRDVSTVIVHYVLCP